MNSACLQIRCNLHGRDAFIQAPERLLGWMGSLAVVRQDAGVWVDATVWQHLFQGYEPVFSDSLDPER